MAKTKAMSEIGPTTYTNGQIFYPTDQALPGDDMQADAPAAEEAPAGEPDAVEPAQAETQKKKRAPRKARA